MGHPADPSSPYELASPYELVLGDRLSELHPRLRAYFSAIQCGQLGIGTGTFTTVGTPRYWLWPVLWVLKRQGVLFPVWERDVPFTVVNRPVRDGRGQVAVAAIRTFQLRAGSASMVDAITAESSGLVDHLGASRRYLAHLSAEVVDGELRMTSTRLAVRVGSRSLVIPHRLSPTVTLVERFDDVTDRQQVTVTVDAPLLGRLYEYAGSFSYEHRPGEGIA